MPAEFFRCFARQAGHVGVRGLADLIDPRLGRAVDFFDRVLADYRKRHDRAGQRAEMQQLAALEGRRAEEAIDAALRDVRIDNDGLRREVRQYLGTLPDALRRSQRRAADPAGRSLSEAFILAKAEDAMAVFPDRLPLFEAGATLPGRPDWVLAERLGGGGFGEVWRATHRLLGHDVAVKFCADLSPGQRATLAHEAKLAAKLTAAAVGPGVVPLLDTDLTGEPPWLMYEYVGGGTLVEVVHGWPKAGRVTLATGVFHQIAAAVAGVHRLAVVHRDLKPANVLWDATAGRVRVTDFGIGGVVTDRERATGGPTVTGRLRTSLYGSHTPLYASREQQRGDAPDPRDDLYALGVIGYQLYTGDLDEAPGRRFDRVLGLLSVPADIIKLIGECSEDKRADRPADAGAVAARLAPYAPKLPPIRTVVPATPRSPEDDTDLPLADEVTPARGGLFRHLFGRRTDRPVTDAGVRRFAFAPCELPTTMRYDNEDHVIRLPHTDARSHIFNLHFTPDSRGLLVSDELSLALYDVNTAEQLWTSPAIGKHDLIFSPDGCRLCVCDQNETTSPYLLNMQNGNIAFRLGEGVCGATQNYSQSNRLKMYAAVFVESVLVTAWGARMPSEEALIAFAADGSIKWRRRLESRVKLASAGNRVYVYFSTLNDGKSVVMAYDVNGQPTAINFLPPSEDSLSALQRDMDPDMHPILATDRFDFALCPIRSSRDGRILASNRGKYVLLWDAKVGGHASLVGLRETGYTDSKASLNSVTLSGEGQVFAINTFYGGEIRVIDLTTGKATRFNASQQTDYGCFYNACYALSPDGRTLATGLFSNCGVRVWKLRG